MSNRKELLDNEAEQIVAGFEFTWNGMIGTLKPDASNDYDYVFLNKGTMLARATELFNAGKKDAEVVSILHSEGLIMTKAEYVNSL